MSKYRVILETKAIAHKWWGQMWCQNIDNYADFTNRLERGRAYIRSGRVHDLMIEKGRISATVDGSMAEPYDVLIMIDPLPDSEIKKLLNKIVNLNAFKDGFVPEDYKFLFSLENGGLFPREDELSFGCSCPDVAIMCKHIAAVLYAVGSIIDQEPLLLFQLRGIDVDAYLDAEIREKTNQLLVMAKNFNDESRLIEDDLISKFFGIELGDMHSPERSYSVENTVPMVDSEIRTIVIGRAPKATRQKLPKEAKPLAPDRMVIRQFGLDGTYIAQYEGYDEASEKTGVPKRTMQRNICGEKKSGGGFIWKKVPANTDQADIDPLQYDDDPQKKPVCQYGRDGVFITEFASISEAARETGISIQTIRNALNDGKQSKGFRWAYKETTTSVVKEDQPLTTETSEDEPPMQQNNQESLSDSTETQDETIEEATTSELIEGKRDGFSIAIGKDVRGNTLVQNMAQIPRLFIAGCSGSGKTAFIETLLTMMASSCSPEEVQYVIYSSKPSEYLTLQNIPHMSVPVTYDAMHYNRVLQWICREAYRRLSVFSKVYAKDLEGYNRRSDKTYPHIFVVIDDYCELIRFGDSSVVETIRNLIDKGPHAGIHLVVATSTPSAKTLQKDILASFPCRACFAVASKVESRLVLDQNTTFGLEAPGEMVFKTFGSIQKCRATYMDEDALLKAASDIKSKYKRSDDAFSDNPPDPFVNGFDARSYGDSRALNKADQEETESGYDEYLYPAVEAVLEAGSCSVSMLQRRVKLGYSRAACLVDQMEELGIVGPYEGAKPRSILIDRKGWEQIKAKLERSESDLDFECEDESGGDDEAPVANNKNAVETINLRPFPKFDVGNASFSIVDSKVHMSKVAQMKNGSGAISFSFPADAIAEIILRKPRLFVGGYFQFVFEDEADIEIKSSTYVDLDASDFTALTKTSFNRSQASTVYSFLDQLSDDADLQITVS